MRTYGNPTYVTSSSLNSPGEPPIICQRALETGTFTASRFDSGAPRWRRTPSWKRLLHAVEEDTTTSTRRVERRLNVDHKTVWCILHNQQLHPYQHQGVQAMRPEDFVPRVKFCRCFLHRCADELDFPRRILFIDEAKFTW